MSRDSMDGKRTWQSKHDYTLMSLARRIASKYMHDDEYVWSNASDIEVDQRNALAQKVYDVIKDDYYSKRGTGAMWLKAEMLKWDRDASEYLPHIIRLVTGQTNESMKSFKQFCEQGPVGPPPATPPAVPAGGAITSSAVAGLPVKLFQKPIRRKYPRRIAVKQ